jgi:MFS family permease
MTSSTQATGDVGKSRKAPLIALFTAKTISSVGDVLALIAIPWLVLQTSGSAAQTGLVAFVSALAAIVAAFFGGVIVDRLGYKRTSIIADVISGVTVALVPFLYAIGQLGFPTLLALVFLGALLDAPGATARDALLPSVARLANMPLARASSVVEGINRGARLIGAPLAGVLIALLGPVNVLWLDAISFAVSALLMLALVPSAGATTAPADDSSYLASLQEGLRFIRRDRLILTIVATLMITNFIDTALSAVVMPVYAKTVFGSAIDLGVMIAVFGGAALVGTIIFGAFGHRLARRSIFIIGFVIVSSRFWVLALNPGLPIVLLTQAISGLAIAPINPILNTVGYERVPETMRARVFGAITAGVLVAIPLGTLLVGYLLEWTGIQTTLFILGAAYLVTTLSLTLNPALYDMDRPDTAVERVPSQAS